MGVIPRKAITMTRECAAFNMRSRRRDAGGSVFVAAAALSDDASERCRNRRNHERSRNQAPVLIPTISITIGDKER